MHCNDRLIVSTNVFFYGQHFLIFRFNIPPTLKLAKVNKFKILYFIIFISESEICVSEKSNTGTCMMKSTYFFVAESSMQVALFIALILSIQKAYRHACPSNNVYNHEA